MNTMKCLRDFKEHAASPFLEKHVKEFDIPTVMLNLSKSSQKFIKYMLNRNLFSEEKMLIDIDDFLSVSGYKTKTSVFRILKELCQKDILARTKYRCIYWVNSGLIDKSLDK
ncbi:MAG: hypothetical protein NMK33_06555 (plasmid) [Candidatus Cardinium sp.]|nr:MAG: hypothetical protein NMK33_06555 [Candidatus Cardinium sp.]